MIRYEAVCFVVMPFGRREVGGREVDFDDIYERILKRAIEQAPRPEGGYLEARRTDHDFFAGDINEEMFRYLEYSRLVVADITSLNPNVFYELGARHHARENGTIILRQPGTMLPFDIRSVKAFPYEYEPEEHAEESRQLVRRVVAGSLIQLRLDSPIQAVIRRQQNRSIRAEAMSLEAENEMRRLDPMAAIATLRSLVARADSTVLDRMKLGLLLKEQGLWREALDTFRAITAQAPDYAEAWREQGIAENKRAPDGRRTDAAGEASLRRAIELNPTDFDAHASLGGVLKRAGRLPEALEAYAAASEYSNHHPYPLLNMLKLRAALEGELRLSSADQRALARARRLRSQQADNEPAYDPPWSHFDMAELSLLAGEPDTAVAYLERGLEQVAADWQVTTFRSSLALLEDVRRPVPGLEQLLARLE